MNSSFLNFRVEYKSLVEWHPLREWDAYTKVVWDIRYICQ
jgi:hypothetical protein